MSAASLDDAALAGARELDAGAVPRGGWEAEARRLRALLRLLYEREAGARGCVVTVLVSEPGRVDVGVTASREEDEPAMAAAVRAELAGVVSAAVAEVAEKAVMAELDALLKGGAR